MTDLSGRLVKAQTVGNDLTPPGLRVVSSSEALLIPHISLLLPETTHLLEHLMHFLLLIYSGRVTVS